MMKVLWQIKYIDLDACGQRGYTCVGLPMRRVVATIAIIASAVVIVPFRVSVAVSAAAAASRASISVAVAAAVRHDVVCCSDRERFVEARSGVSGLDD